MIQKIIKILFSIAIIGLAFILGWKYLVGILFGMTVMGYQLLFPSPIMRIVFDNLFGYSNKEMTIMKEESEENDEKIQKIRNARKVKFS